MSLSRKLKRLHDKKERAEEGTKKIKRKVPEFLEPHLLLTDVQLEGLGLGSAKTRRNQRWRGEDPIPHVRVGKRLVRYRLQDVLAYVEKNRVTN